MQVCEHLTFPCLIFLWENLRFLALACFYRHTLASPETRPNSALLAHFKAEVASGSSNFHGIHVDFWRHGIWKWGKHHYLEDHPS